MEIPKYESSNTYAVPAGVVFNAVVQAVQYLPGWRIREVNPAGWYITGSVEFSLWSYGENILVQVTETTPCQPLVNASSSSVFALFDFGRNRRNTEKLFAAVQSILAQAGYGAAPPQQPQSPITAQQPVVVAVPGPTAAPSFCPNCGAGLRPEAKFCTGCGQQM